MNVIKRLFPAVFICRLFMSEVNAQVSRHALSITDTAKTRYGQTDQPAGNKTKTDAFLEDLLRKYPEYFGKILENRDLYKLQIIYTQIDRDKQNNPQFRDYYLNVNPDNYFYPASTVKLPIALLALQRFHEMRIPGLDKYSSMITEAGFSGQTPVFNDPGSRDGRPSVANYVKKIFLVSDNDACNRLYEFLGQEYINNQMNKMGYTGTVILKRLVLDLTEEENRHTNPITFLDSTGRKLYVQPMQYSSFVYPEHHDSVGNGYLTNDGKAVNHAMDFSRRNRISLENLHQLIRSVIFPSSLPQKQQFNLSDDDYRFLLTYLSQYPSESVYPSYDTATDWPGSRKLLYWGAAKGALPKNLRIFNKEGDSYGFLTDAAYVVDFDKKIEFMLSATIYCNADGILNDDHYDYETVGLPFLKQLGQVIYTFELTRNRAVVPDLSRFRMRYDR